MDKEEIREKITSIEEKIPFPRSVTAVLLTAFLVRIAFWLILPPTWKMHAAVYSLDKSFLEYCGDFIGYKAGRPPFIDFVMGRTYLITKSFLGTKGLTLFPTALSIISLPFGYEFVRKVFDEKVAFYSLIFLAFYPKFAYIAARGLPETSSLALVIISLYFLKRGFEDGKIYFLVSGMLASLAYLFYLPAILSIGVTFLFLIFRNRRKIINGIKQSFYFFILPALVFCLHWLKGPFKEVLFGNVSAGGIRESIFINPEAYSLLEKAGRYVLYSFFDFWWHFRGFDYEHAIMKRVDVFSQHIPFFNFAALVWLSAAALLTVPVLYSFKLLKKKRENDWLLYVFITFGLYWAWWWYKAVFKHGLQTRHIFPQIAFMSVLFGLGVVEMRKNFDEIKKYIAPVLYLSLTVLLVTALGHAVMFSRAYDATFTEPVRFIEENELEGDIGVTDGRSTRFFMSTSPELQLNTILINATEENEFRPRLDSYVSLDELSIEEFKENNLDYVINTNFFGSSSQYHPDVFNCQAEDCTLVYESTFSSAGTRIYRIN